MNTSKKHLNKSAFYFDMSSPIFLIYHLLFNLFILTAYI
ncbi:putative membrane protein [Acinetobacter sp. 263903-1]|nr:putative membrane protein [Acinetobacter sp. 1461402]EXB74233.1 putative membrane protein [Acinetobacter sp. 230853]EXC32499.1 putative membrane protein [Acinetobacter sp. 869535]EXE15234.1 putative membrane protein [Acinetobacter sp. 983759]KCX38819.1 putative membrane protein [Acinetobacter sp. 263903-1]